MLDRRFMFARYPLRLRFAIDPATGVEAVIPPVDPPVDLGFPADTALADMTEPERTAYFKHHSRRHESEATGLKAKLAGMSDYDDLKAKADAANAAAAASATDSEKAIAAAKAAGLAEGKNTYLEDAVRGELRAQTGKSADELAGALDLIDVKKLTLADGTLDLDKITAFAATLGTASAPEEDVPPANPTKDVFDRISTAPPGGALSIAETVKARAAELTTTK